MRENSTKIQKKYRNPRNTRFLGIGVSRNMRFIPEVKSEGLGCYSKSVCLPFC